MIFTCEARSVACEKRDTVIFDIDGTLLDTSSIEHLVDPDAPTPYEMYARFHTASLGAPANDWVASQARLLSAEGFRVVLLTARSEIWLDVTQQWVGDNGIPCDALIMREADDYQPDPSMKLEAARGLALDHHIVHAFEDRIDVARMWSSAGVPVTLVPSNLGPPL